MQRRNRRATTERLVLATLDLIREDGFEGVGINAVATRAGVSKVLIYRYFGDLDGLLRAAADRLDVLDADVTVQEAAAVSQDAPPAELLRRTITALRAAATRDDLIRRILVWELSHRNALTDALAENRESVGLEMTAAFDELWKSRGGNPDVDVHALLALLTAGVTFLSLRSDTVRYFNGIDIQSDEGWRRLADVLTPFTEEK